MSSFPEGAFPGVFTLWRRSLSLKSGLNLLRPFPGSSCWIGDRDFPFPGTSVRIPGKNDPLEPPGAALEPEFPHGSGLKAAPGYSRFAKRPREFRWRFSGCASQDIPGNNLGRARLRQTGMHEERGWDGWEGVGAAGIPNKFSGISSPGENAELRTEPPEIWGKTDFSFLFFFFLNFFPFPPVSLPAGITEFSPPRTTPPPAWPFPGSAPR